MEDFILIKDKLISIPNHNISIFAIFDGHNGHIVSEFLFKNFHNFFQKNLKKFNFKIEETISQSFSDIDEHLKSIDNTNKTGSTATVVIIDNSILYCANVGDSRCYFVSKNKLIQLTKDHNCKDKDEVKRVENSQGKVFMNRVFGVLQLTRSIGDLELKGYGVICTPFISKQKINKDSQFCILASDGVWDQMEIEEIEEYTKNNNDLDSQKLCNYLIDTSLERFTRDNVSCIVIQFN
jgi:serine/threonine protein phosphatase PrpC